MRKVMQKIRCACAVLLLVGSISCRSAADRKVEELTTSGQYTLQDNGVIAREYESGYDDLITEIGGRDPLEGFNRSMFEVQDVFFRYVFRPVGYFYGSILPAPAIRAVNRLTDNLSFPRRMLSNFCRAEFTAGGIEFLRFLSNSTLGIAGLFDPAEAWFGLEQQESDFGLAFASWGIGPGCQIFLPGLGASNIRDGVGYIFDYALDPKSYFYGGQAFAMLNNGMVLYRSYENMYYSSFDPYIQMRDLNLLSRELAVSGDDLLKGTVFDATLQDPLPQPEGGVTLSGYPEQGGDVDTLRAALFDSVDGSVWTYLSIFNGSFANSGQLRSVPLAKNRPEMDYVFYRQNENPYAPLVVILPGLGSYCSSANVTGLAEILHGKGYAVLAMSNAMHWQFAAAAPGEFMPGFTPTDVRIIRRAIDAAVHQLREKERCFPSSILLTGYSLGALETLFVAATGDEEFQEKFERYVAINPPADLFYGLRQLDRYYTEDAPGNFTLARKKLLTAAAKEMTVIGAKAAEQGYFGTVTDLTANGNIALPVTQEEARLLIGYSFRRSLQELLIARHKDLNIPALEIPWSWGNRHELYREIGQFNYERYLMDVVLPFYENRLNTNLSADKLNYLSGVYAIEDTLRNNSSVRVLHTANDFLLREEDKAFFRETLDDRLILFNTGGHLGNFFHPEFQKEFLAAFQ